MRVARRLQSGHRGVGRGAERGDAGDVLRPRPPPQLLPAAAQQRLEPLHALGEDHRTDALGTADLVRRQRQHIGPVSTRSTGIFPSAWIASTCSSPPAACDNVGRPRATGWIAPVSLLASITETSAAGPPSSRVRR